MSQTEVARKKASLTCVEDDIDAAAVMQRNQNTWLAPEAVASDELQTEDVQDMRDFENN